MTEDARAHGISVWNGAPVISARLSDKLIELDASPAAVRELNAATSRAVRSYTMGRS
jgi:hypothetical protein